MHGQRSGYVRVSSFDQNPERQLEQVPGGRLFTDQASGKNTQRPELKSARGSLTEGKIARVVFCVDENRMVLLHGFIKKIQKKLQKEIDLALKRKKGDER